MSRNPFPFDERIPLVPDILVRGPQAGELIEPTDPMQWTESCVVRALGSSVAGGVMGFAFGALFSGYGSLQPMDHGEFPPRMAVTRPPIGITGGRPATLAPPSLLPPFIPLPGALPYSHYEAPSQPLMAAFKDGLKDMKVRSVSQGKTFMVVGGIFSAVECALEKVRGKRDMKNAIVAGFTTGALLAVRAGPGAMLLGGGGFAAFSVIIEIASPYLFE